MTDRALARISIALSVPGLAITGYLTYVHYAGLRPICAISHGCETVQTSSYASLGGIPVALLGLITWALILLTLIATGFSAYLTYREVFTIHAICSWCVSSAVVFTLLAIVGTVRVLHGITVFPPAPAESA